MDTGIEMLHMRAAILAGRERSCNGKVNYKSEETAAKAAAKMNSSGKAKHELEPYPCPFCEGANLKLPNGEEINLKDHGWHIGRKMHVDELEKVTGITAAKAEEAGCPISNEGLFRSIGIYESENIFAIHEPEAVADPAAREIFKIGYDAYRRLKELLEENH
jgi:hypothetical protein